MLSVLIYDNGHATGALLSPLTDLRAVFAVRTGALTTLQRISLRARLDDLPRPDGLIVPDALGELAREQHAPLPVNDHVRLSEALLLVNGACPLNDTDATGIELGEALVDPATNTILKAHIRRDPSAIARILRGDTSGLTIRHCPAPAATLSRPWHIRAHRDACIATDLALITRARTDWQMHTSAWSSAGGVFASSSATIHPSVIIDSEGGPGGGLGGGPGAGAGSSIVVIDDHAVIRPGAIIVGPAYVGPHSTVLERSLIKAGTAIGPHCKVAGEIGGTIFQGYANKSHEGHLGDSWIGKWANLGAGTTNSNLLNTYGDIICRPLPSPTSDISNLKSDIPRNERTGQQFLGATIGDHVKTAICTRIMTGAIVGTGTMFAASAPLSGTIPPLSWITDSGTKPFAPDKFIEIARTVMARRKVVPSAAYLSRLRSLGPA